MDDPQTIQPSGKKEKTTGKGAVLGSHKKKPVSSVETLYSALDVATCFSLANGDGVLLIQLTL